MDAERGRRVSDPFLVARVSFLNIELFEFL